MIHIEKDKEIFGEVNLRIATATGDYEDSALIEFYEITNPGIVAGAFQAQYVKYGNLVYGFNDPVDLGSAILVVDPVSTHTAASYVRMTQELLAQMNGGNLEATSLDEVMATEQENMEQKKEEAVTEEETIEEETIEEETTKEEVEEATEESEEDTTEDEPEETEDPIIEEEEVIDEVLPEEETIEDVLPVIEEEPIPAPIEDVVPEVPVAEPEPVSILRRKSKRKIV